MARCVCVLGAVLALQWGCSSDASSKEGRRIDGSSRSPSPATTTGVHRPEQNDDFGNGPAPSSDDEATDAPGQDDAPQAADRCGDLCVVTEAGGDGAPFDLDANPADGVGLDADGALVLRRDDGSAGDQLIWIANTSEYTVSKVDTRSTTELGRYAVAINASKSPADNGPSRTTIDGDGNLYAGARIGDHVTKISAAGEACPDTNGDGAITTSTGPADVLALGQDDCMLWSTDIGGDARGLALQEIPATFSVEPQPDGEPVITEVPGARYLWVGGYDVTNLHKIDAETGEVLFTIPAPTPVYGLALDGRGNLWISGRSKDTGLFGQPPALGRVDTTRCVDASCAAETVCTNVCTFASCGGGCDGAVLERVQVEGGNLYGVTVDCNQRVWIGGAHGGEDVRRYDPLATGNQRLALAPNVSATGADGIHGIAADSSGFIWGAGGEQGVWRIDGDTLQAVQVAGTGGSELAAKGIAIDKAGRVWAIPLRREYALVIEPGPTLDDATVSKPLTGFVGPYTYSDMTGEQTRLAANEPGSYRQLFEGCAQGPTSWRELDWDVELPDGTTVVFQARTADTVEALEAAEWFTLAALPGREAPLEIDPFIASAAQLPGKYIEIEVRLVTTETGGESRDGCTFTDATTPRVKAFSISHACTPDLG